MPPQPPPARYSVHGQIVRLDDKDKLAAIRHEEIKGWMGAMTMEFPVRESTDWKSLQVDGCIDATVFVREKVEYWIGEVKAAPADSCARPTPTAH